MTQRLLSYQRGFTLAECLAVLLVLIVLLVILVPVCSTQYYGKPRQDQCLSHEKQIGMALLGYAADYDDTFPPVLGKVTLSDGTKHEQQWGLDTFATVKNNQELVSGLISSYYVIAGFLECPASQTPNEGVSYLYSDLAAGEPIKSFIAPANTVVIADGEDRMRNIGHARSQSAGGDEAVTRSVAGSSVPKVLLGAAVGNAVTRHSGGGNYGFADGHAKWLTPDVVFFPLRSSDSRDHRDAKTGQILGPDPSGATEKDRTYQGKAYTATFHLR